MKFTKMQAYGNDYVYIETFTTQVFSPEKLARFVSRTHFGVGSDGMILICPSDISDFKMRVFNPDGSEAEMCGNALRSVGKYVFTKGLTEKTDFTVETLGGVKHIHLYLKADTVENISADIGEPILETERIPCLIKNTDQSLINFPYEVDGKSFFLTAVSLGNPHCAVLTDDVDNLDIVKYGSFFECNEIFPNKANVHFYQPIDRKTIRMRAWERNCGETMACGTGCSSVAVAAVLCGLCDREIDVVQPGGIVHIEYKEADNHIIMTGKSEFVFDGEFDDRLIDEVCK